MMLYRLVYNDLPTNVSGLRSLKAMQLVVLHRKFKLPTVTPDQLKQSTGDYFMHYQNFVL